MCATFTGAVARDTVIGNLVAKWKCYANVAGADYAVYRKDVDVAGLNTKKGTAETARNTARDLT